MPWVEFHATTIIRLQKFRDFRSDLSWSRHEALGFLGDLWGQVLELREDGDIRGWTPEYIADLTGLKPVIAARLWDALVKHRWVELKQDGAVLVHDWLEFVGRYLESKYRSSDPELLAQMWRKHGQKYAKKAASQMPNGWARVRLEVLQRDGFKCRYCNKVDRDRMEVDHVIPRASGGSSLPENLVAACRSCNRKKGVRSRVDQSLSKGSPPNLTSPLPPTGEHLTRACNNSNPGDKSDTRKGGALRKVGAWAPGGGGERTTAQEDEDLLHRHRMPFGNYKGQTIAGIPVDRCRWLLTKWEGKANLDATTRRALEARIRLSAEGRKR